MNNSIVIRMQGGLGNQLFQYAYGYMLSTQLGSSLYLDTYFLENTHDSDTVRNYELTPYKISATVLSDRERKKLRILKPGYITKALAKTQVKFLNTRYIYENTNSSETKIQTTGDETIVAHGFWQHLLYLSNINHHMIGVLSSYEIVNLELQKYLAIASVTNSVSIHVRRGDYITNRNTKQLHHVCDMEYYRRAIIELKRNIITNPQFLIFSDDPLWVRTEFAWLDQESTIISNLELSSHDELLLMSHCKHNIISNSTYSWWGAWSNTNCRKVVIAPKIWHRNSDNPPLDLIPSGWILI